MNQMDKVIQRALRHVIRYAPHLEEDLIAEGRLAYLECKGVDAFIHVLKALRIYAWRYRTAVPYTPMNRFERAYSDYLVFTRTAARRLRPKKRLSAKQKLRFRRDLVIQAAGAMGCPQRLLAEVLGESKSLIAQVLGKDLSKVFRDSGD